MSRNFGIAHVTRRPTSSGGQPLAASHYASGAQRDSISLAAPSTPDGSRPNLAVVIGNRSFLPQREFNPVQELNAALDRREFAVCIFVSVFFTFVFGAPIAIAVALMSWG